VEVEVTSRVLAGIETSIDPNWNDYNAHKVTNVSRVEYATLDVMVQVVWKGIVTTVVWEESEKNENEATSRVAVM